MTVTLEDGGTATTAAAELPMDTPNLPGIVPAYLHMLAGRVSRAVVMASGEADAQQVGTHAEAAPPARTLAEVIRALEDAEAWGRWSSVRWVDARKRLGDLESAMVKMELQVDADLCLARGEGTVEPDPGHAAYLEGILAELRDHRARLSGL